MSKKQIAFAVVLAVAGVAALGYAFAQNAAQRAAPLTVGVQQLDDQKLAGIVGAQEGEDSGHDWCGIHEDCGYDDVPCPSNPSGSIGSKCGTTTEYLRPKSCVGVVYNDTQCFGSVNQVVAQCFWIYDCEIGINGEDLVCIKDSSASIGAGRAVYQNSNCHGNY